MDALFLLLWPTKLQIIAFMVSKDQTKKAKFSWRINMEDNILIRKEKYISFFQTKNYQKCNENESINIEKGRGKDTYL